MTDTPNSDALKASVRAAAERTAALSDDERAELLAEMRAVQASSRATRNLEDAETRLTSGVNPLDTQKTLPQEYCRRLSEQLNSIRSQHPDDPVEAWSSFLTTATAFLADPIHANASTLARRENLANEIAYSAEILRHERRSPLLDYMGLRNRGELKKAPANFPPALRTLHEKWSAFRENRFNSIMIGRAWLTKDGLPHEENASNVTLHQLVHKQSVGGVFTYILNHGSAFFESLEKQSNLTITPDERKSLLAAIQAAVDMPKPPRKR
jgi:hypothetical protein